MNAPSALEVIMVSLLTLCLTSFLLSLILTPVFRRLYIALGWVDHPDNLRKIHRKPIPSAGGVPIMLAYVGAFAIVFLLGTNGGHHIAARSETIWGLLPAALLVFAIGILDDILSLKPWQKFAGQFLAAGLAWHAGVQIHALHGSLLDTWLALPITLLWLVGCTNAFNLIDGLDGLATGIGLFASLTIFIAAILSGNVILQYATAPLIGALLGFLRYNFNPASIFLGDSGSLTIGFLLGCFGVLWSQKAATMLGLAAPLIALALPLVDTALAIVRRFLRGQPIFTADRGHIHHRLLDRGLSVRAVAILLYGVCGLAAAASLLATLSKNRYGGLVLVLFCAVAWLGVSLLGYAEFTEARRLIFGGLFRRALNHSLRVNRLEHDLAKASSDEECWHSVSALCTDLGFTEALLRLNDHEYKSRFNLSPNESWKVHIPLRGGDFIHLALPFDAPIQPTVIARLANVLRRHLSNSPGPAKTPEPLRPLSLTTTAGK